MMGRETPAAASPGRESLEPNAPFPPKVKAGHLSAHVGAAAHLDLFDYKTDWSNGTTKLPGRVPERQTFRVPLRAFPS